MDHYAKGYQILAHIGATQQLLYSERHEISSLQNLTTKHLSLALNVGIINIEKIQYIVIMCGQTGQGVHLMIIY